jgi:glutamate/tyrosine decarboxylase-like PLP-dependent enzyme
VALKESDVDSQHADPLRLDASTRAQLWTAVGAAIEAYHQDVSGLDAATMARPEEVRRALARFDFDHPLPPAEAVALAVDAMRRLQPHVLHPRHFGLFDPAPTAMGVLADAMVAAFNPCLATWAGSPVGVETERLLIERFAAVFGYPPDAADGTLTSGGSEANLSGLLLALAARIPEYRDAGLRRMAADPTVYLTEQAHPSWLKAVRIAGLGSLAMRVVPAGYTGGMDADELARLVAADRAAGRLPLVAVATAGTTAAGVIDPIQAVAAVAERFGLWLHVDAAWGGAAMLLPECRPALAGIERADSITFDPHKWLSVPIGCGMLLTRHRGALERTFGVSATFLAGLDEGAGADPFGRSMRWSRDFAGLKLLLSLAVAGWRGYEDVLRRQVRLADRLRDRLLRDGWRIVNHTVLPVVCFTPASTAPGGDPLALVAALVNGSGQARVFQVRAGGQPALRACVTNYATTEADVDLLADLLAAARADVDSGTVDAAAVLAAAGRAPSACGTGPPA